MRQNADSAESFRSLVDSDVEASRRRYGAERADPATPTVAAEAEARLCEETARKGGQRPERSATQISAINKGYDRYTYGSHQLRTASHGFSAIELRKRSFSAPSGIVQFHPGEGLDNMYPRGM